MSHTDLVSISADNGTENYADIIVRVGTKSTFNDRDYTLHASSDGEFLQGPSGKAFWSFYLDNVPPPQAVIKVKLTSRPNSGQGFYQNVERWRLATVDEIPPAVNGDAPQITPARFARTDATGRSIERQVAYKGMVELAVGYVDNVEGHNLMLRALEMAEVLWHEELPNPESPAADHDDPTFEQYADDDPGYQAE